MSVGFYTYNSTSGYQNGVDSGSLIEEYIVHSGSYRDGQSYRLVSRPSFSSEKVIISYIKLNPTNTDSWNYIWKNICKW